MTSKALIALLALISCIGSVKANSQLVHILEPEANWLNPVSGSYISLTVQANLETESTGSVILLVGLPWTPTSTPSASVTVSTSSCGLDSASSSGASVWLATNNRASLDGLTYYWVSSEVAYTPDTYINIMITVDFPTTSGWTNPISLALTTTSGDDYMIIAENCNIAPLRILDAPSDTLTVLDKTTDSKKSITGSTFSATAQITSTMDCRRFGIMLSGYTLDADITSLIFSWVDDVGLITPYASTEYEVEYISSMALEVRWANNSEVIPAGEYQITFRANVPLTPSTATLIVYAMDKYGPAIIEKGQVVSIFTSGYIPWASGYPKVAFSYGMDAASADVKASYGLYTWSGTSLTYNHLSFSLRESSYDIPSGSQTLTFTIGSGSNAAYPACGSLVHSLPAYSGSEVSCTCGSSSIICTGVGLTKGTDATLAIKIAYAFSVKITDYAKVVMTIGGVTIVQGTPSLKSGFSTPMANKSPVSSSKWGESITGSVSSMYVESSTTFTATTLQSNLLLNSDYNGLRKGKGTRASRASGLGTREENSE